MSTDRNIPDDQTKTRYLLQLLAQPNWLGHSGGAATLDYLLLHGATMEVMEMHRGAVRNHFSHLEDEHGLTVIERNDVYRFALIAD